MKSSPEPSKITVLIADDHPVVQEGLAAIFKSQKDMEVVAEAINGEEALELCNRHLPDVLLLDLRMPIAASAERRLKTRLGVTLHG
jgi:YesN/AraC family two-component response regulator